MKDPVEVAIGSDRQVTEIGDQLGELMDDPEGPQLSPTSGHKRFARGAFALTQMKIKGLRPSTVYYFQVQACNQIGVSDWSGASLPMKMGSCAPAKCWKPRFLSGNVRDGMTIYWQVPDTYGEGDVTRYDVRLSTHAMMKDHRMVEKVKFGMSTPPLHHIRSFAASSSDATLPTPTFEIKIQRIDGSSQRVDVSADMTGLQLKELIAQKLGISTEQRLICRGRAIKDDDLIGAHVTENGQIVHMVQRPAPGPPPPAGGSAAGPPAPVMQGVPPMMPGMAVPFSSQSQVLHIAMPDFMTGGMAPGPGPGPPVPPGPSFVGPDRNAPVGMHLMQAVEAAQAAWRGTGEAAAHHGPTTASIHDYGRESHERYALAWKSASSRAHGTWFTCAIASTDGAASGYRLWRSTTHGGHATTAFSTSHASTDACGAPRLSRARSGSGDPTIAGRSASSTWPNLKQWKWIYQPPARAGTAMAGAAKAPFPSHSGAGPLQWLSACQFASRWLSARGGDASISDIPACSNFTTGSGSK
eukprot:symbB.v1.2.008668.t1/scaffold537.1/size221706/12